MHKTSQAVSKLLPYATEASWATGRWDTLRKYLSFAPEEIGGDFNVSVGRILLALHSGNSESFAGTIRALREQIAGSLSVDTTSSLGSCHDSMLKFHVLTELEMIAGSTNDAVVDHKQSVESLGRRLEAIGAYLNDKQYLLGIRRAAMMLSRSVFILALIVSS
jgi:serine/threonine-protein kinase ATR